MSARPQSDRTLGCTAAAHWFNEHRAGDMTDADKRLFNQWLCQSPENRAAYRRIERHWAMFEAVAQDPQILAAREQDRRTFDKPSRWRRAGLAVAAVLLSVTTSWTVIDSGLAGDIDIAQHTETAIYRTHLGQRLTFSLSDGSSVSLDTDSALQVSDMRANRSLELLRGRAFFNVAKDPSRPFIVRAGAKTVRALGTAFQVSMQGDDVTVTLVEGLVRVEADGGPAQPDPPPVDIQQPGGRLSAPQDSNWVVEQVDVHLQTSWLNGHLVFLGEPLADAIAEINRYSQQKLTFIDNGLPEPEILGVFRTGDVESFVRALEIDNIARVTSRNKTQIAIELLPQPNLAAPDQRPATPGYHRRAVGP
ncbi:DUF4880 domain-containing protein [Exilibacterium tricleocarpae]|uniref:DUF4880 domain-containing protein n=1 Tax=Exilibacterium tricleocarpae TaxID=2591008 RepID=A0A545TNW7_9GAMM|nr:FecR domain-containing protein [Exilibacterium tricleocarpae]TQV78906.1 DUF4880 domain-containing protein [Exilibacterium tricleocarpae]